MAAKHASVKLSTEFLNDARREAEAFKRSVAAQVEHWARIGRAVENTPGLGVSDVQSLFDGRFKVEDLPPSVRGAFWGHMTEAFKSSDAEAEAYYAELASRDGAVGRNEQGDLVRREPSGGLRRIG